MIAAMTAGTSISRRRVSRAFALPCLLLASSLALPQSTELSGEQLYAKFCAACHDAGGGRTPPRDALTRLSPKRIMRTMDFGLMMSVAYPIRRDERERLARYLGRGAEDDAALPPGARCTDAQPMFPRAGASSWGSWSPDPGNTRHQRAAAARLTGGDVGRLRLKWAYGFAGDVIAFAAPTLVDGTLFVGSAGGTIQALDARTGCIHWTWDADGPVRTPPTITEHAGQRMLLLTDQIGGVYALDARSGRQLWKTRVEEHESTRLTGTIVTHEGLAFVPAASWEESRAVDPDYPCCTFRGSVSALRLADGSLAWKTWLVDEPRQTGVSAAGTPKYGPSGVGVWSAPTLDAARGLIYVGTGNNYTHPATALSNSVVALEMQTGHIAWSRQLTPDDVFNAQCARGGESGCGPDHDIAAPPMLVSRTEEKDVLVVGQKSGVVFGLDPARKGEPLWETRVGIGSSAGGVQWGMASDGRQVYAAVADAARTAGDQGSLQIGNATFDPRKGGGLTALDVRTGKRVWFAPGTPCDPPREGCSPAQPGAVTSIDGAVFSGAMDGHIRAFSTVDGRLLWDFDTQRPFETVNGHPAQGGSLDGAGAVVADGMVYVNSGYPRIGGAPGNVLLAFGLD